MKITNEMKGVGSITLTAMAFAIATIFARWIGNEIPLFYQSATRALFCAVLIFAWIFLIKRQSIKYYKEDTVWMLLRSLGGVIGFLCFFVAVNQTTIGVTYFAYFAGTLLASYMSAYLFFNEKITKIKLLSLFLAIVGLILTYFQSGLFKFDWYILLALVGGVSYSFWSLLVKKLKGGYSILQIEAIDFAIQGILYGVASLLAREHWMGPAINMPWIGSLGIAIMWIFGGLWLVYGFKRVQATVGGLILLAEVPFAILIGEIFFKEKLSLLVWVGGALILIACALPEAKALLNRKYHHEKA